jgi:hypothetical protein
VVLAAGSLAGLFLPAPSGRGQRLEELCGNGAQLRSVKLLDEAVVPYTRAQAEGDPCATKPLEHIQEAQARRSDHIEQARIDRVVAARAHADGARNAQARWDAAYDQYLKAFRLDARSPGARSGFRALLRARELGGRACDHAKQLRVHRFLFEARVVGGACPEQLGMVVRLRRRAAIAVARADALAAAGDDRGAFDEYIAAAQSDPSSPRVLNGLRALPPVTVPEQQSFDAYAWRKLSAVTAGTGDAARVGRLLAAILLVGAVLFGIRARRRADRDERAAARYRAKGLGALVDRRYEVVGEPGAAAPGQEAVFEIIAEEIRRPGVLDRRPDDADIVASVRPLDMWSAPAGNPVVDDLLFILTGGDALSRTFSAGSRLLQRRPQALVTHISSDGRTVETRLPRRFREDRLISSHASELADEAADPRARRAALARLHGERVRAAVVS